MATIGIDLTPIQGPHRLRGVGSTVINILRHLSQYDKQAHVFVFYAYKDGQQEALSHINVSNFPNYKVRTVKNAQPLAPSIKTAAGLLYIPHRVRNKILDYQIGNKRISDVSDLDVFLQFEQDIIPPKGVRSVVIAYDLIPYVLEKDYLWTYGTARKLHNYSRRGALKAQAKRNIYLHTIRSAMHRATKVVAISEHTKSDFVKLVNIKESKIEVCHLGVSLSDTSKQVERTDIDRYINTSWGDIKIKANLPNTPFLLFVGGADPRRKLADLVHAFNLLRAQGYSVHLILAGDTMLGPNSIPNSEARKALLSSSYLDDIYLLGFINNSTREWLYQNALVFVYPSKYEGFGLPILEAMNHGTPVITYKNSSISEIGKDEIQYAADFSEIAELTKKYIETKDTDRAKRIAHAQKFSWNMTAKNLMNLLLN